MLLSHLVYIKKLLNRTTHHNMLTEACKLYLENDYIVTAWKALSNLTYFVTMPYLNCIERSNQNDLVDILPKLYKDLLNGKMNTLDEFRVHWTHVSMKKQSQKVS